MFSIGWCWHLFLASIVAKLSNLFIAFFLCAPRQYSYDCRAVDSTEKSKLNRIECLLLVSEHPHTNIGIRCV